MSKLGAPLILLIGVGFLAGMTAAFTGLGGGVLVVPALLFMGYQPGRAVGTSFLVIILISASALLSHARLLHVDYRVGLALGIGGLLGAQLGATLVDYVPVDIFKKILAGILVVLAFKLAL